MYKRMPFMQTVLLLPYGGTISLSLALPAIWMMCRLSFVCWPSTFLPNSATHCARVIPEDVQYHYMFTCYDPILKKEVTRSHVGVPISIFDEVMSGDSVPWSPTSSSSLSTCTVCPPPFNCVASHYLLQHNETQFIRTRGMEEMVVFSFLSAHLCCGLWQSIRRQLGPVRLFLPHASLFNFAEFLCVANCFSNIQQVICVCAREELSIADQALFFPDLMLQGLLCTPINPYLFACVLQFPCTCKTSHKFKIRPFAWAPARASSKLRTISYPFFVKGILGGLKGAGQCVCVPFCVPLCGLHSWGCLSFVICCPPPFVILIIKCVCLVANFPVM